jgi:hypothetical protein
VSEQQRIRCPKCSALAAPGAEWCGQCFARLVEPVEPRQAPAPRRAAAPQLPQNDVPAPPMPVAPYDPAIEGERREGGERRMQEARRAPVDRRVGEDRRAPVDRRVGEDRRAEDGHPTPASLLAALWEMPTVPEPAGLNGPGASPSTHPSAIASGNPPPASVPTEPLFLDAEPLPPRATWPCAVCGSPNDLDDDMCTSCGAPFSRLFQEESSLPKVDPKRAARASLILPGLGHAVAGKKAEGVARAILFFWCAATAILLLAARPAGGLGILAPMAVVFVLCTLLWYAVTALDAVRLASGDKQLVSPKLMLYGVAALMMLSVGSAFLLVTKASHLPH